MTEEGKAKWGITIDTMMIVGKYFESNNDYINVMKVCKRYRDLTQMYHFNPIDDTSLFINMQTQHFYKNQEVKNESLKTKLSEHFSSNPQYQVKRKGMNQYIYWCYDAELKNNLKENEVMKPINPMKFISNNIDKLEEWSGKKYSSVLYDSDIDGKDSSIFSEKIMNHQHLYFIVIDSDNNVFGHYHPSQITKELGNGNYDDDIFLFTLNSNGRSEVMKFNNNKSKHTNTYIWGKMMFYYIGYDGTSSFNSCYVMDKFDGNNYVRDNYLTQAFDEIESTTLTGNCHPNKFIPKRLVVIEMK